MFQFFNKPGPEFTHHARVYGVGCYYGEEGEGMRLMGYTAVGDFLIEHWVPLAQWMVETARALLMGIEYEPLGFAVQLRGEIKRS